MGRRFPRGRALLVAVAISWIAAGAGANDIRYQPRDITNLGGLKARASAHL